MLKKNKFLGNGILNNNGSVVKKRLGSFDFSVSIILRTEKILGRPNPISPMWLRPYLDMFAEYANSDHHVLWAASWTIWWQIISDLPWQWELGPSCSENTTKLYVRGPTDLAPRALRHSSQSGTQEVCVYFVCMNIDVKRVDIITWFWRWKLVFIEALECYPNGLANVGVGFY